MKRIIPFLLFALSLSVSAQTMPQGGDPKLWAQALKIHRKAIVIDGHNDITGPMVDEDFDLITDTVIFSRLRSTMAQVQQASLTANAMIEELRWCVP